MHLTRRGFIALLTLAFVSSAFCSARTQKRLDSDWRFWLDTSIRPRKNDVAKWHWRPLGSPPNTGASSLQSALAGQPTGDFKTTQAGADVFHGRRGFSLFEAQLQADFGTARSGALHFESVDDNATVYIDGSLTFHHEGWDDPFDVPLNGFRNGQEFTVDVLVENTDGPGGIGASYFVSAESIKSPPQANAGFNDESWRRVHLPHDYVVEGKFVPDGDPGHGSLPRGVGWYRKRFFLPTSASGRSVSIDFEGAFSDAHVWLNSTFLGEHRSGYTGFRFDISSFAKFGGWNVVSVRLDARKTEGWWYEGGGLYRHVWLTIQDRVHVAPLGGIYVTAAIRNPLATDPSASVRVVAEVVNSSGRGVSCSVHESLIRPDGGTAAKAVSDFRLAPGSGQVAVKLSEPHARLWSLDNPQLYTLRTRVYANRSLVDEVETPVGIRTTRWDPDQGFFLNGRPVKLKGTCNHQDFAGVGIGMPDSVLEWRIMKLKEMGSNAYRCAHNEVASELLDACDRQGMLVMDENREFGDTWTGKASRGTTTKDLSDLRQEVLRDRNHPCVIIWSIANEEFGVMNTPAGGRIAKTLVALVHRLDPTRPVTAAMNGGHGSYMSRELDLEGFNYGPEGYAPYHQSHRDHPMFASETASTTTTRGEYADDKVRGYVRAYDIEGANSAEDAWQPIAEEPYNAGGFVWTGFDYKGEPTPYGWPCVNSHFGILDLCGFPKDNYFFYKAWWGNKPVVHIEPHWNWPGREGRPIDVWVFGNGNEVELFLNGKSLGRKTMPKYRHLSWQVPYEPGTLVAKSFVDDHLVATDTVSTTGAPAALKVTTTRKYLTGDGEDCAMLEVWVVDSQGREVPTASNLVRFSASGPGRIAGVGNGDPSCHEPDRAPTRHAFNGRCLGILQARDQEGVVRVSITSPGLRSASTTLKVRPERS